MRASIVRTPLVGRKETLAAVQEALLRGPLVTLLGPGGMGKTRIALELATASDVLIVELVDVPADASVLDVLVAELGVGGRQGAVGELLRTTLSRRGYRLLVLDNVEHLVADVRSALRVLFTEASGLQVVCTSRRVLGIAGEQVVEVQPLTTHASKTLFLERVPALAASSVTPGPALDRLIQRLEGVPLAIELAATRLEVLSLEALEARLSESLSILRNPELGGSRHGSVAAVLEWSWSMLAAVEQQTLSQLMVFRGGIPLDAAEGVLSLPSGTPLDGIQLLVRHSLLQRAGEEGGVPRFHMLEMVREFVGGRVSPEQLAALRMRHAVWFSQQGVAWRSSYDDDEDSRARLHADEANLLAARAWGLGNSGVEGRAVALKVQDALQIVLSLRLRREAHLALIAEVVEPLDTLPAGIPAIRMVRGYALLLARSGRDAEARAYMRVAAQRAREENDPQTTLHVLVLSWTLALEDGDVQTAMSELEELEALGRRHPGISEPMRARATRGLLALYAGNDPLADSLFATLNDSDGSSDGMVLGIRADERWIRGDLCGALALARRCVEAYRLAPSRVWLTSSVARLVQLELLNAGLASAKTSLHEIAAKERWIEESTSARLTAGLLGIVAGADAVPARYLADCGSQTLHPENLATAGFLLAARGLTQVESRAFADAETSFRRAREFLAAVPMFEADPTMAACHALTEAAASLAVDGESPVQLEVINRLRASLSVPLLKEAETVRQAALAVCQRMTRHIMAYRVARDGSWFAPPVGDRIDLSRRPTLAGIVSVLAAAAPGDSLPLEAVFDAGWPGERVVDKAGKNRVYVAINTLRRLGLEPLVKDRNGYQLASDRVRLVDVD